LDAANICGKKGSLCGPGTQWSTKGYGAGRIRNPNKGLRIVSMQDEDFAETRKGTQLMFDRNLGFIFRSLFIGWLAILDPAQKRWKKNIGFSERHRIPVQDRNWPRNEIFERGARAVLEPQLLRTGTAKGTSKWQLRILRVARPANLGGFTG